MGFNPKILYLSNLNNHPSCISHKILEEVVGDRNVHVLRFYVRWIVLICSLPTIFLIIAILALMAFFLNTHHFWIFSLLLIFLILLLYPLYLITVKITAHLMLKSSIKEAERVSSIFDPSIIVASEYGAIVALRMRTSYRRPTILLSPSCERFCAASYLNLKFSLAKFPYVLIICGSKDPALGGARKLLKKEQDVTKGRLEIIDGLSTDLRAVSSKDFTTWIKEVLYKKDPTDVETQNFYDAKDDRTLYDDKSTSDSEVNDAVTERLLP